MTDATEEMKVLQSRILGLEETIAAYKKRDDDREKSGKRADSEARIESLTKQLESTQAELTNLRTKFWDGKNRRNDERRGKPKPIETKKDEAEWLGGHFA